VARNTLPFSEAELSLLLKGDLQGNYAESRILTAQSGAAAHPREGRFVGVRELYFEHSQYPS
jgi:hypothetical protein